jgi:vanillate O-demethylase ferredoxin subunit
MSGALRRISVVVTDARLIARDVKRLDLTAIDGRSLPAVEPGAHLDLWLPEVGARQYSIVERAEDGSRYTIAVLRHPSSRGGSSYVVDSVHRGQTLEIGGPRNNFALDDGADDYVLIAGGIGVTPLVPMARRLSERGRRFAFHYLNRSPERAAFLDLLRADPLGRHLRLHFDDADGRPDIAGMIGPARATAQIYVCGPSGLIDAVLDAARDWGPHAVRFERFSHEAPKPDGDDGGFEVKLARSSKVVPVGPGETILEAIGKSGVTVEAVCKEGICGSCMVPILAGEADHRDAIQTETERRANKYICLCVSRATSPRLVLDL